MFVGGKLWWNGVDLMNSDAIVANNFQYLSVNYKIHIVHHHHIIDYRWCSGSDNIFQLEYGKKLYIVSKNSKVSMLFSWSSLKLLICFIIFIFLYELQSWNIYSTFLNFLNWTKYSSPVRPCSLWTTVNIYWSP